MAKLDVTKLIIEKISIIIAYSVLLSLLREESFFWFKKLFITIILTRVRKMFKLMLLANISSFTVKVLNKAYLCDI